MGSLKTIFVALLSLFVASAFAGEKNHSSDQSLQHFVITHPTSKSEGPLSIEVRGLGASQKVVILARGLDTQGTKWFSWGAFQADKTGRIALSKQAPIEGSYEGVQPLGLFHSLKPLSKATLKSKSKLKEIELSLVVDGSIRSSTILSLPKKRK